MAEKPVKTTARQRRNALYRDPVEPATGERFRVMPPQRPRPGEPEGLVEPLRATKVSHHEFHEAPGAAKGTDPGTHDPRGYEPATTPQLDGSSAARQRRRVVHLQRTLMRIDVWILIATIALVVLTYLTLLKIR
jgi:hypothetical protein